MSRDMVSTRARSGRLTPTRYGGVYAWGHDRLRPEGLFTAAVLAVGEGAALGHHAAGAHRELLNSARRDIDITIESRSGRKAPRGIQLHCVRHLDPRDVSIYRGILTTTVARTIVDLAADRLPRHAERALERAYQQRLLRPGELEDAMARAVGRPTRVLRALIARDGPTSFTRNDLEEAMLVISRAQGLPDPEVNAPVLHYEADFLWREKRLIIETDGYAAHSSKRAFEHDHKRDVDLDLAGYKVRRFTHDQVMLEPEETGRRLRALYDGQ